MSPLRRVVANRLLLWNLVSRDIKVRYKRTLLGVLWALLEPLLRMVIYTVVFSQILRVDAQPYPVFVLAGLLPWNLLRASLSTAEVSIVGNATLIRKMVFPHEILVLAGMGSNLINFAISLLLLVPLLLAYQVPLTTSLAALPALVAVQLLLVLGTSLALAAICVEYRDVGFLAAFALSALFYLSPVLYPSSLVPEALKTVYQWNPLAVLIDAYRAAIMGTPWPAPTQLLFCALVAATVFVAGYVYFRAKSRYFAELL